MFEEQDEKELVKEPNEAGQVERPMSGTPQRRWLSFLSVLILSAAGISFVGYVRERRQARQLAADNAQMNWVLGQTRSQMTALNDKLNSLSAQLAAEQAASAAQAAPVPSRHRASVRSAGKSHVEDPRWKQIQAQLDEHKKQIAETQQDVARTRADLEGNLNSTKNELGGQIARNHDELVALEKRGERSYYEFDLTKSKEFRRVGPISLALRKADTKHDQYDMILLVNDDRLAKKRVSLYEPVLLYAADSDQAVELVVNHIEKNRVRGYVSEPKYSKAETAATPAASSGPASPDGTSATLAHRTDSPH